MIQPFFHPTITVLVDEDKSIFPILQVASEDTLYQYFDDPAEALLYCQEKSYQALKPKNAVASSITSGAAPAENCTEFIKTVLLNPNRFDAVSVILVNCSNPTQFVDKLKEVEPAKIILLVNEAEQAEALRLLNAKRIDKFFVKNDASLEEKIKGAINELQQAYFAELSQNTSATLLIPLFNEAVFLDFFSKIRQKFKICEYYFCKNMNSFILVDKDGISYVLVLRSKNDLFFSAEYARLQHVYSELVNRILMGRLIPFLGSVDARPTKMEDWIIHTYRAKKIEGQEDYYYALIEGRKTAVLTCIQNIKGFAAFVQNGVEFIK